MSIFSFSQRVIMITVIMCYSLSAQNYQWAREIIGDVSGRDIKTDIFGNSYLTGMFYSSATFENIEITASGLSAVFAAKYDANGNFQWVQKANSQQAASVMILKLAY